jgi:biotin carboxyl carrier protein
MREYLLSIGEKDYKAEVKEINAQEAVVIINGVEYRVKLKQLGQNQQIPERKTIEKKTASTPMAATQVKTTHESANTITSPLPGLILEISVKEGDSVKAGQTVLIMESMKMENQIQAPYDGIVKKILVKNGDNVLEGENLLEISRPFMTTL